MKVLTIMGCILIIAGIIQVFLQMYSHYKAEKLREVWKQTGIQTVHVGRRFRVSSAYPGTTMICIGALLLAAGEYFAAT